MRHDCSIVIEWVQPDCTFTHVNETLLISDCVEVGQAGGGGNVE